MLAFDDVPRLREDEPLVDALGELATEPPGRALVLDGGQVVGLLSISDVGRLVAAAGTGSRSGGRRAG
jgi:CBS domain-containing protein